MLIGICTSRAVDELRAAGAIEIKYTMRGLTASAGMPGDARSVHTIPYVDWMGYRVSSVRLGDVCGAIRDELHKKQLTKG